MRVLLLLVLAASLVWFVWRGVGPGGAGDGEAQAAPGSMIATDGGAASPSPQSESRSAPGSAPAAGPSQRLSEASAAQVPSSPSSTAAGADSGARAGSTLASGADAPVQPPSAAAAGGDPTRAPSVLRPATPALPAIPASPLEVAAAEELLREPAALAAWLAARGLELPAPRRELASALVHAFAGRETEARAALDRAQAGGGLSEAERRVVLGITPPTPDLVPIAAESALARAGSMKLAEARAAEHLAAGRAREAAASYSSLLLAELASPWRAAPDRLAAWSAKLREAQRGHRWSRRGSWASHEIVVKPGDSLISVRKRAIAERPDLVVCTGQIARSNELQDEVIHPGMKLRVPLEPVSILVDLDAHWCFYLAGDEVVAAWPVGVGREESATRVGTYRVGEKTKEPMWFPQGRKPVPFGDRENPLGTRWIAWELDDGATTGLGIHGTNEPESIGRDGSQGCIRMRTEDVEELYEIVPRGAVVNVQP